MKTTIYGLILWSVLLIVPAYADECVGGYEPFITAAADAAAEAEAKKKLEETFVDLD